MAGGWQTCFTGMGKTHAGQRCSSRYRAMLHTLTSHSTAQHAPKPQHPAATRLNEPWIPGKTTPRCPILPGLPGLPRPDSRAGALERRNLYLRGTPKRRNF